MRIYYTNDMHNRQGALEQLQQAPDLAAALLLDGGDALAGSNTAFRWREPVLDRMSGLGYRAMAMGNREFHYFRWVQRRRARERRFPLLAANLRDLRGDELLWDSHLTLSWAGLRVGVLGVTPVQFPVGSPWERITGFRFLDPATSLAPLIEELRPRVDLLILLSHLGLPADRELLPGLPAVDLTLGGHSHDFTPEPLRLGNGWLVHGGSHSRYLGILDLELAPLRVVWSPQLLAQSA